MIALLIALTGSVGAVSRFVLDGHIKTRRARRFPWATFVINVTGSFVLGLVTGALLHHKGFADAETIVGIGFCGGYTTFSTASFETVRLLERRDYTRALCNAAGGLATTVVAAFVGLLLGMQT